MIKIINRIRLTENGLVIGRSKQLAHLRQGEIDGACAVYSMMMCLIIEQVIKRKIVTDVPDKKKLKRNTSEGRLIRHFLERQGMIVEGYEIENLSIELKRAFSKKVTPLYDNIEINADFMKDVIEYLDDNHPVEIGFSYTKKSGHAVVAVGYEIGNDVISLFCLDPGYDLVEGQYWNNILEIDTSSSVKYNCTNLRDKRKVFVDEMMVVLKK